MGTKKLKSIVDQAQEAVQDVEDESLKKIAFQKVLDTLLNPVQTTPPPGSSLGQVQKQTQDTTMGDNLSEFFTQKGPKSHPDMVLTFAHFFHYKGGGDFNVGDVISAYKKVLIPAPKNPTDIINQNIRKGFINKQDRQKDSKQAYQITKYGIDYVNNNYTGKSKAVHSPKKREKKKDEQTE